MDRIFDSVMTDLTENEWPLFIKLQQYSYLFENYVNKVNMKKNNPLRGLVKKVEETKKLLS